MKKVIHQHWMIHSFVSSICFSFKIKSGFATFAVVFFFACLTAIGQTNNYFGASGTVTSAVWSTNPGGPYTSLLNLTGGAIINFANPAIVTGATIDIAGINATANVTTWTGGGTLGTGGTVIPVHVAGGVTLNMISQAISTAAGTGFIKTGSGVLAMSTGSTYQGGFTLTDGTIIVGGLNALGGNRLTLAGGIIASNANRDLSDKYPGGITIGGDVQFGDVTGLAGSTANLTFNNNVSLGLSNRTFILGNTGTTTFGGVISGSTGITFTKNANGTGLFDITNTSNIFSGPVNLDGGQIRFASNGSFGAAGNPIVIDGGQMHTDAFLTIDHPIQIGNSPGSGIHVAANTVTINSVISNKATSAEFTKSGAGTLVLSNANTLTGITHISAGTLQLNRPGGNTLLPANDIIVNGGILQISANQTLNSISLVTGNLAVDNGVTLTINGTFEYFTSASTITLTGTGKIAYGPSGTLKYAGGTVVTATIKEWPVAAAPVNIISNNSVGIILPFNRAITVSLALNSGTFTIGAGVLLNLDGASVTSAGGYLAGNALSNSTSDLTVGGFTGGNIVIPTNNLNIGLRNVTVQGSRKLTLNGLNNLNLSGTLFIESGAVFDNGGESQVIDGGVPVISINGTFITRDMNGFSGVNAAIPFINPTLNAGCTVEYGLGTGGTQVVNSRNDYSNLKISGSGIKIPSSAFSPVGNIIITGAATFDCTGSNIGDSSTNLLMDGGRLVVGTGGVQPAMSGLYNLTGGVVEYAGTTAKTIRAQTYQNIEVTGSNVGNSAGNIVLNHLGTFTVKSGGVFTINDNNITGPTGTQTVTVENSGIFKCGNNKGFHGFTPTLLENSSLNANIENINLTSGCTINYARDNDQVITNANGLIYQNLTISGTAGVKTAPPGIVTVAGDLVKSGTSVFDANGGTVLLNGGTQDFAGLTYHNLLLDNSGTKNLTSNAAILDSLTIGNLNTNPVTNLSLGNNFLTLQSTASKTARIGTVSPSATITYGGTGRFVVERYFTPRRAWRLVTAPITAEAGRSIFNSWQMGGANTSRSGIFITGPLAPAGGLDISPVMNYSLKTWDASTSNLMGVSDTKNNLISGTNGIAGSPDNYGMFLFVRGDRSTTNLFYPPNTNETTLRDTGKVQVKTQTFSFPATPVNGYALIGNPYASPVNMDNVMTTGVGIDTDKYYTYDPFLNIDQGGYLTFTRNISTGIFSPTPSSPGGQTNILHSGQAFYVQKINAGASLSFTENNKAGSDSLGLFRPPVSNIQAFRANLYFLKSDHSAVLADGILAQFDDSYENAVDKTDAVKFANIRENLSLRREGKTLSVENRRAIQGDDTLYLNLKGTTPRNYQFRFEPENLDPLLNAFLEDNYTGTKTPISITSPGIVDFTINGAAASADPGRFRIVFKQTGTGPLPVTFSNLTAFERGNNIAVEWEVENEINIAVYEVEKSIDGVHFRKVNTIGAINANLNRNSYNWLDEEPVPGENYYRIRSIDRSGNTDFSRIVKVKMGKDLPGLRIYPNPVADRLIFIEFRNKEEGVYRVRLFNSIGQTLLQKKIRHAAGTTIEKIKPGNNPGPGVYQLEITSPNKEIKSFKLVMQ